MAEHIPIQGAIDAGQVPQYTSRPAMSRDSWDGATEKGSLGVYQAALRVQNSPTLRGAGLDRTN